MKIISSITCLCFTFSLLSCSVPPSKKIVGTYVRESTWYTANIDSGVIIGTAYLRDTIFITERKECYKIKNVKWRKNDYDNKGWRNQLHAKNRPLPTYAVSYDQMDQSLNPINTAIGSIIYMDFEKGLISLNRRMEKPWKKIRYLITRNKSSKRHSNL